MCRHASSFRHQLKQLQHSFNAVADTRIPVIAAIQGGCIGGAVDLATACCLRYCSRDAWFCIQEINIGMMADVGTLNRMPKQIPEAVMRELAYTGDRLGADRPSDWASSTDCSTTLPPPCRGPAVAHKIAARAPGRGRQQRTAELHPRPFGGRELCLHECAAARLFDPEDIARAVAAQKAGTPAAFADLPPIQPALG